MLIAESTWDEKSPLQNRLSSSDKRNDSGEIATLASFNRSSTVGSDAANGVDVPNDSIFLSVTILPAPSRYS